MKHSIACGAITLALILSPSAHAADGGMASAKDARCIAFAKLSQTYAEGRDKGISEDSAIATSKKIFADSKMGEVFQSKVARVISYVYMMGYSPTDTRKIIYLKCGVGEFDE